MREIESKLSDEEMARVTAEAKRLGMEVDEYVTLAASSELRRRFATPSSGGQVVPLRGPKREGL